MLRRIRFSELWPGGVSHRRFKKVSETVTSASKAVENGGLDLMLIQDESVPSFRKAKGVYDFHGNELTIVKQYLPMADALEDSFCQCQ